MTSKHILPIALLAASGLLLGGCEVTEANAGRVDCGAPGPGGVDCQVKRTAGTGAFQACWDLVISCQNGGKMTGSACHAMAAGASEGTQNMPVASFSNQDSCDVPSSGAVENLKINNG